MDVRHGRTRIELCEFRLIPKIWEYVAGLKIELKVIPPVPYQTTNCKEVIYPCGQREALAWGTFAVEFAYPENTDLDVRFEIKVPRNAELGRKETNGSAQLKLNKINFWDDTSVQLEGPEPFAVLRFFTRTSNLGRKCRILSLMVGVNVAEQAIDLDPRTMCRLVDSVAGGLNYHRLMHMASQTTWCTAIRDMIKASPDTYGARVRGWLNEHQKDAQELEKGTLSLSNLQWLGLLQAIAQDDAVALQTVGDVLGHVVGHRVDTAEISDAEGNGLAELVGEVGDSGG
eukprot:m51a1_g12476 hypothetical protein (286) ;mRNA; r:678-4031